jgi:hypothetical protein
MNTTKLKLSTITLLTYALCASCTIALGEPTPTDWNKLTDDDRQAYTNNVSAVIANPTIGPAAQHDKWLAEKQAEGWVYGENKDDEAKTHPLIVPFEELPVEVRIKDQLFHSTVLQLSGVDIELEDNQTADKAEKPSKAGSSNAPGVPEGFTPIRYIGKRDEYVENAYGTKIKFNQGETELVPSDKAILLLRHPDQYERGDVKAAKKPQTPVNAKTDDKDKDTEDQLQEARDLVANMDVAALKEYALTNFSGHKLHPNIGVDKARIQVTQLIDQFGIK